MSYAVTNQTEGIRVRWEHDHDYQTRGSYALDSEEETRAVEDQEIARIESGEWVALSAHVEQWCEHCARWFERDALHGIVIAPLAAELSAFAKDSLDLGVTQ